MNTLHRCHFVICAALALAICVADRALAQRVRFTSPYDEETAERAISVASLPDAGAVSSTPTFSAPSATTAAPTNTITYVPVYLVQAPGTPSTTLASSLGTPPVFGSAFDPYRVASRPAAFSGMITSTSTGGNVLLPQPMPRVPYYTQQPVSNAQPYVVIPDPNCAIPPPSCETPPAYVQPNQFVQPNQYIVPTAPAAVAPPPVYAAPPPVYTAPPPTVPTLVPPLQPAPVIAGRCYAAVDAIFFTRNAEIGNQPLVLLDGNGPLEPNVLISTADLDFGWQVGPRLTLGREFDSFRAFEGTYFGIFNFSESANAAIPDSLNAPGDVGLLTSFFQADTAAVEYDSEIQNGELNYLQSYGNISGLIGFRYFFLGEQFSLTFDDDITGTGQYNINAYNNLFGGQVGARVTQACGNWSYDLTGKAGVYDNVIRSRQRITDQDGLLLVRDERNDGSKLAFLGEIGLNGAYHCGPVWSIRGGYQVYWVEGLALAPNQIDFTIPGGTTLDKTGGMFLHGAHAGLAAQW